MIYKKISLPNGVTTIDIAAFNYCRNAEVKLPESITGIGQWAFGSAPESYCKKVYIKSGAQFDTIKGLVTGSGYPAAGIVSY